MRILIVIHGFPPEYMAGSEVYTWHLAKELDKNHEVIIFHRIENPFIEEYELIKTKFQGLTKYVINIPYLPHYFDGRYINEKVDKIFREFLVDINPDIIHFGHLNYLSTNLTSIAKNQGYPIIFTLHDYWLYCPRGQLINRRDNSLCAQIDFEKCIQCLREYLPKGDKNKIQSRIDYIQDKVVNIVDHFIAPSYFLKNKMIEFGIPNTKISYLDYGFNLDYFKNFKKIKSEKIRFGYIGRIIPVKGVHLIIDAFNMIENNEAELMIYGSSPALAFLENRSKNPNIHFCGSYNNWEIGKVLSEIDVLIVPSIWFENSPLVIHEAAVAKVPVIATNLGGMAEYVTDGKNGLLFERANANDLRNKIMFFIEHPDKIQNMGENAMKVQSIEEHTKNIEKIYLKHLGGKWNFSK